MICLNILQNEILYVTTENTYVTLIQLYSRNELRVGTRGTRVDDASEVAAAPLDILRTLPLSICTASTRQQA